MLCTAPRAWDLDLKRFWWRANRIDIGPITDAGETLLVSQVALFYHRCRERPYLCQVMGLFSITDVGGNRIVPRQGASLWVADQHFVFSVSFI